MAFKGQPSEDVKKSVALICNSKACRIFCERTPYMDLGLLAALNTAHTRLLPLGGCEGRKGCRKAGGAQSVVKSFF